MKDELFKIVGIVIVCFFLFYLAMKSLKLQLSVMEGFLGSSDSSAPTDSTETSALAGSTTGPAISPGSGKAASQYAGKIKAVVDKLQNSMSVAQYKKDYEMTILNLDDYINYSMLNILGSMNPTSPVGDELNMELIKSLNVLNQGKDSLNSVMKFVDRF